MSEERVPYVVAVHEPVDQRKHPVFRIFDKPIAFHRSFVTLTGSVNAALMLSQAFYWTPRTSSPAGWFYKSADEWEEETGLTRREQETARRHLREFPWWQEELRKANGVPTLHYRIDGNGFQQSLESLMAQTAIPISTNAPIPGVSTNAPIPITEITTEITAESTRVANAAPVDEKEKKPTTDNSVDTYKVWHKNIGRPKPATEEALDYLVMQYGTSIVVEAIKTAVNENRREGKPTLAFVAAIAKRLYEESKLSEQRISAITPTKLAGKEYQVVVDAGLLATRQKLLEEMENEKNEQK